MNGQRSFSYCLCAMVLCLLFSIQVKAEGTLFFVHNDHLGTPQAITDTDKNIVWKANYKPFGEVAEVVAAIDMPARFPGQYYDKETGYHYNYYRDYDPSLGRYIQSDPIGLNGGLNTYGYVGGNPLSYSDPLGLCPWCAIGAVVGGTVNGAAYALTTSNFTWSGLGKQVVIGVVVGGITAAVPGYIAAGSLNFGRMNTLVGLGAAAAAGTAGGIANQLGQCQPVNYNQALLAGASNAAGLGIGRVFQPIARSMSTTIVVGNSGLPVTSLTGRTFMVGSQPSKQVVSQATQQFIQDFTGASFSSATSSGL